MFQYLKQNYNEIKKEKSRLQSYNIIIDNSHTCLNNLKVRLDDTFWHAYSVVWPAFFLNVGPNIFKFNAAFHNIPVI